ncbi:MAG: segregation/condensation protein A [Rhodospirillales bacterium]|nr:segregation/condensation protein A [Rhodospirillales bacterium]
MTTAEPAPDAAFIVDVDGWEGPVDLLLALARTQKVDLRQISIVQLADQYLAYVAEARRASLELAAEYLVMAAWLAELKSRLLLPEPEGPEEPSSDEMAGALAFQLRRLDGMREAGAALFARPQLGRDFWSRGRPETVEERIATSVRAGLHDLLRAYGDHLRRRRRDEPLDLSEPIELDSVEAALARIHLSLGQAPGWESLMRYLPAGALEGLRAGSLTARSSLAATFVAMLELVRQGRGVVRRNQPFGPIYVRHNADGERDGIDPSQ